MAELGKVKTSRKTGREQFRCAGADLGFDLLGFWQWSASDLVSNATRGVLAEYIVARAVGIAENGIREEWAAHDLTMPNGLRIEVKSAAYVQSWSQRKLSDVKFIVRKTRAWDAESNRQATESIRQADVYVLALLAHTDKATIDALNLDQWQFYVVPTSFFDGRKRSQHSITVPSLNKEGFAPVPYTQLREALNRIAGGLGRSG